jgi:hypothetical protein
LASLSEAEIPLASRDWEAGDAGSPLILVTNWRCFLFLYSPNNCIDILRNQVHHNGGSFDLRDVRFAKDSPRLCDFSGTCRTEAQSHHQSMA